MKIQATAARANVLETMGQAAATMPNTMTPGVKPPAAGSDNPRLRKAFDNFVGETFYGQMLKSMRSTLGTPAYFNGGRAEEVFTQQFDQVLGQKLSHSGADHLAAPMYHLFTLGRR
jgi:Rod binding domain-containing protein